MCVCVRVCECVCVCVCVCERRCRDTHRGCVYLMVYMWACEGVGVTKHRWVCEGVYE